MHKKKGIRESEVGRDRIYGQYFEIVGGVMLKRKMGTAGMKFGTAFLFLLLLPGG